MMFSQAMTHNIPESDANKRFASLFSGCRQAPYGNSHLWNIDSGRCQFCGARLPYAVEDREKK